MSRIFAVSVLATWAALLLELAVVSALHRTAITAAWELAVGAGLLAPAALVLALPCGLLGGLAATLLSSGSRPGRVTLALILGAGAGTAAFLVATGRHFAAEGARSTFGAISGALGALVVYGFAPLGGRALRTHPGRFAAATLALSGSLELANRLLLVRLYPAFHSALAALSLVLVALAGSRIRPPRRFPWAVPSGVLATGIAALLLVRPAAEGLAGFDNFRLLLVDDAPILGEAVRVAAALSPPPPLREMDACSDGSSACQPGVSVADGPSLSGRDVVVISIDALRADHVGAYGYARPTTPNLDALARDAAVFEHAYCPTPHTSYSLTSLMTGKYMRPLLLQGAGEDSDTLATILRRYGYRTAAFYPPAVFFIDQARFTAFERTTFGFEYAKVEFLEGEGRVRQVASYLHDLPPGQPLLLWVHLFGPHEPYEAHREYPFGERDVDRYDSEVAAADETVGALVRLVRASRPTAVVVVTADHGEEFGEHGGRYHGTSVYEEQVRVPLVISAPSVVSARRIHTVVQTIDVLPTLLSALSIPASPRIRGKSFAPLLGGAPEGPGLAFAETEESALLAEGPARLVCARKLGACRLYDVDRDPGEREDLSASDPGRLAALRTELALLGGSHGRFEILGQRAETGKGYPAAIRRALSGDGDAAPDLALLLDDADRDIRRKAAELLFVLHRDGTSSALRLALGRDEDRDVRNWCALALTRLGQTAPLVFEMFREGDVRWKRFAALALAETGDGRGEAVLVDWWQHGGGDDYELGLSLLGAFTRIRAKDAVWPLVQALKGVRLRPRIAETLAAIGDDTARGPLVAALEDERYQTARVAITEALVALRAKEELARPLIRFLGVPDPIPNGVGAALRAKILDLIGGPNDKTLVTLRAQSNIGALLRVVIPKTGNGSGVRVIVRARAEGRSGEIRIGRRLEPVQFNLKGEAINTRKVPRIHGSDYVALTVPPGPAAVEVSHTLPASLGCAPGRAVELVLFAEAHVTLEGLVLVPLSDELPPPLPEPWKPGASPGAPVH